MYILTDVNDIVVYKSKTGKTIEGGFLVDNDTMTWAVPGAQMYEVDAIPDGHGLGKSCYTADKGFFTNLDYKEPKTSIEELQDENKLLKSQIQALTERSEFTDDCIAEIATQVYSK